MKVIHVPFCFAPDPFGGTEVFVASLAHDQQELGVDAMVAAPSETSRAYTIDDLRVRRFATSMVTEVAELYGAGDELAAIEFAKILDEEMPDVVHLHAFTRAVSLRLVRAAKNRGIPVIFTYHTPTVSCQRGTLLLLGESICDGKLDVRRCAGCTLDGLGLYGPLAALMGRVSPAAGRWLGDRGLQGGIWTALRTSELIAKRHTAFRQLVSEVDHIVAVCNWVYELLLLNNVPSCKASVSRQGISWMPEQSTAPTSTSALETPETVRLAFLGRLDSTKGVHVLINALRMIPTVKVTLDIYGVVQSSSNARYQKEMLALAEGDPRVSFRGSIGPREVVPRLRRYDFLVVPSQWIETGPMVALEAFAAKIPVIGWNLGGISEIVRHGVDGLLIEPGPVVRWAETLRKVAEDPWLRAHLKAGVRPPRTSFQVAHEMLALYDMVLAFQAAAPTKNILPTGATVDDKDVREHAPNLLHLEDR
jgi:glycosyltransferase involved in cell wall biosynthesis